MIIQAYPVAITSIFLYASVCFVSLYFMVSLIRDKKNYASSALKKIYGRYDDTKILFFALLFASTGLDIPLYIGCLALDGPTDCEWDATSYAALYALHRVACCGYALVIVIPAVLWSDIVNKRDGKLWNSDYPSSKTKIFFQISLTFYVSVILLDLLLVAILYKPSDPDQYDRNPIAETIYLIEPAQIFLISAGCLYSGINLQVYVMQVQLNYNSTMKFLFRLNFTMLLIFLSYCLRAVFLIGEYLLRTDSTDHENPLDASYILWVLTTRWCPNIFCAYSLIYTMRKSGAKIAKKMENSDNESSMGSDVCAEQLLKNSFNGNQYNQIDNSGIDEPLLEEGNSDHSTNSNSISTSNTNQYRYTNNLARISEENHNINTSLFSQNSLSKSLNIPKKNNKVVSIKKENKKNDFHSSRSFNDKNQDDSDDDDSTITEDQDSVIDSSMNLSPINGVDYTSDDSIFMAATNNSYSLNAPSLSSLSLKIPDESRGLIRSADVWGNQQNNIHNNNTPEGRGRAVDVLYNIFHPNEKI